ncbi:MAG TPA: hypothetical protein VG407_17950 [Caulobacteraceae bacterium]|jgi:hypothetical protein|nr:hypothetical protein [Caulobacteraceae bacterium]
MTYRLVGRAAPVSTVLAAALVASLSLIGGDAGAQTPAVYERAPMAQYRMASAADEIALARSAAPASVSGEAEILVLGEHGYESAVEGKNGFVCLVERAWASGLADPEFWNQHERAPICLNPPSVRSVLPNYLKRTQWVLAGASKDEVAARTKAAVASGEIRAPDAGAMSYMMSKTGYLTDSDPHWHPHIMLFLPAMAPSDWGGNDHNNIVSGVASSNAPVTVFFIPVPRWSDGSLDTSMPMEN